MESIALSIENAQDLPDLSTAITRLSLYDFSEPVKNVIRNTAEFIAGKANIDAERRSFQRLDEILPPHISTSDSFQVISHCLMATKLIVDDKIFDFTFDPNSFDIGTISLVGHENNVPTLKKFSGRSLADPATLQKLGKILQEVADAPGQFIGKEVPPPDIHLYKEQVKNICQKVTDVFNKKRKAYRLAITHELRDEKIDITIGLTDIKETITVIASDHGPVIHNHETLHGPFTETMLRGIVDILEKERKEKASIRNKIPFLSTAKSIDAQKRTRQAAFVILSFTVAGGLGATYLATHRSSALHNTSSTSHTSSSLDSSPAPSPVSAQNFVAPLVPAQDLVPPTIPPSSSVPPQDSFDAAQDRPTAVPAQLIVPPTSPSPSHTSAISRIGESSVGSDRNANTERALVHIFSTIPYVHAGRSAHISNRRVLMARLRHALHGQDSTRAAHIEQIFIESHFDTDALVNRLRSEGGSNIASRIVHLRTRPGHDNVIVERREISERRQIRIRVERDGSELYTTDWFTENRAIRRVRT